MKGAKQPNIRATQVEISSRDDRKILISGKEQGRMKELKVIGGIKNEGAEKSKGRFGLRVRKEENLQN